MGEKMHCEQESLQNSFVGKVRVLVYKGAHLNSYKFLTLKTYFVNFVQTLCLVEFVLRMFVVLRIIE